VATDAAECSNLNEPIYDPSNKSSQGPTGSAFCGNRPAATAFGYAGNAPPYNLRCPVAPASLIERVCKFAAKEGERNAKRKNQRNFKGVAHTDQRAASHVSRYGLIDSLSTEKVRIGLR